MGILSLFFTPSGTPSSEILYNENWSIVGLQVGHLIIVCHLYVGPTPTSSDAEDLS